MFKLTLIRTTQVRESSFSPEPAQSHTLAHTRNTTVCLLSCTQCTVFSVCNDLFEPHSCRRLQSYCDFWHTVSGTLSNQAVALSLHSETGDLCKDTGTQSWVSLLECTLTLQRVTRHDPKNAPEREREPGDCRK